MDGQERFQDLRFRWSKAGLSIPTDQTDTLVEVDRGTPGPELVVEYEYKNGKDVSAKPLVVRNNSKLHAAYNVRIEPLTNELCRACFSTPDVIEAGSSGEAKARIPSSSPAFRDHFWEFFTTFPKPTTLTDITAPQTIPMFLYCQDVSGTIGFKTECKVTFVLAWQTVSVGFVKRTVFKLPSEASPNWTT